MIAAAMMYCAAIALLLGLAAFALDKAVALCGAPRRWVWACALAGSWLVPIATITQAKLPLQGAAVAVRDGSPGELSDAGISTPAVSWPALNWPAPPGLDKFLAAFWLAGSAGVLTFWAAAAIRLRRRSRAWPVTRIDGSTVWITDGLGPAVLGYLRPRLLVPRSVLDQPQSVQSIVIRHEHEHIAARDPLLLLSGLLLVVLVPWNPALWWQLRRLRFAIEVDCDARVLRHGVEPIAYGDTLLRINQQLASVPLGTVALTEPCSHLERRIRIMLGGRTRHAAPLTAVFLSLAAPLVLAAVNLDAPPAQPAPVIAESIAAPDTTDRNTKALTDSGAKRTRAANWTTQEAQAPRTPTMTVCYTATSVCTTVPPGGEYTQGVSEPAPPGISSGSASLRASP